MDLYTVGVILSKYQQRAVMSHVKFCTKVSIQSVFTAVLGADPPNVHILCIRDATFFKNKPIF